MVTVSALDHHVVGDRFIAHATNARPHPLNYHLIEMSSGKASSHPLPIDGEKSVDALDLFLLQEEVLQEKFQSDFPAKDALFLPVLLLKPVYIVSSKNNKLFPLLVGAVFLCFDASVATTEILMAGHKVYFFFR